MPKCLPRRRFSPITRRWESRFFCSRWRGSPGAGPTRCPPLPSGLAKWEATLARAVHILFYVLLIGLPLGGWLANSLTGRDIDFFGLFTIPPLPLGENDDLGGSIFDMHALGGNIFIYLIGLHILGALKHTFVDKNGGIFRMLPFGKVPG